MRAMRFYTILGMKLSPLAMLLLGNTVSFFILPKKQYENLVEKPNIQFLWRSPQWLQQQRASESLDGL